MSCDKDLAFLVTLAVFGRKIKRLCCMSMSADKDLNLLLLSALLDKYGIASSLARPLLLYPNQHLA